MTRFTTSAPVERAFMTRKQWQHPSRREHVHNRVQPMHVSRIPWSKLITGAVMAPCVIYAASLWIKP